MKLLKSVGQILGALVFASLMLGRCAFEEGVFSKQVIFMPDEVVTSSIINGNEGNDLVDEYTRKALEQIRKACWQSGWRDLVRTLMWTGPASISLEVSDNLLGPRKMTVDCSKF